MSQIATEYQVREQMFNTLYKDYQQKIERYLVTLVYNQEQASDLRQEAYMQLLEFLRNETVVKQYAYYRNWLYKTATFRAVDYLRRNKPMVYLSQIESEANSWSDKLRTEGLEDRIDLVDLPNELLQLPPKQRECLVEYAEGYKQKEIAENKGISEAAVSGYMRMGRTNLRNKKSFVVTADLEERRRVSREIDETTNRMLFESFTILYKIEHNENLMSSPNYVDRVLGQHIKEDALIMSTLESTFEELLRFEQESFKEIDDNHMRNLIRYYDRTFGKTLRRVLIDAENQNRGLLSDTAVLGAYGQYLF